ncbi:hypothetical protein NHX12_018055 [Muraenolepis orangiensis]|uniref:Ras-GAP domain-containing protein n=1 Tax=Muraenolepis orangiensis TaxID=630683 RepID=A0A9Q0EXM6_9TELE|nr:hypothetical protein NHX12_018055 [Muraenolepis orangiensis]
MGNEENDSELVAEHELTEAKQMVVDKEPEAGRHSELTSESADPLNIYNWQTGPKGTPGNGKGDGGATAGTSPMDRVQKSTTRWTKIQNWRKALSDDLSDRPFSQSPSPMKSGGGAGAKPEKACAARKSPFRRAMSEPTGSLFATLTSSSSKSGQATPSSTATTDASGASTGDASQRAGGGALFRKCLKTVSQRLKRPLLQSRHSTHTLLSDVGKKESELRRLQWAPPQDVPLWDISNCILEDGQILICPDDEPLMWTRNRVSSCLSNLSMQNLAEINTECSPEPVGQASAARFKTQDGGVRALIKRRLEGRAKRNSTTQINAIGLGSRLYGSRESVSIPVSVAGSLDLSADTSTVIRPVHSSILGEKYCFEVINSETNHCFGCTSAAERDRWIEDLRRAAQPNKDNIERTENSLSLWVNEAKDLPPKRRYFWEVHLDGTLFARTSSRAVDKCVQHSSLAGDGSSSSGGLGGSSSHAGGCQLFWGEFFELDNLPLVSQVTLYLFRDEDPKKKRLSRDESCLHPLGSVAISLAEIRGRAYQEKWHPIIPYKAVGSGSSKDLLGPQASLRIKARFQNLKVLPMERYKEFAEFVTVDYVDMCQSLEPLLSVKEKEELAGVLVHVLQSIGKAKEFLIDLGGAEVERLGEKAALIFRENTLATKAIDEYMKLVGQKYLIDTLGHFIFGLYASVENCEVDPLKCSSADLSSNQRHLTETCEEVVQKITEMHGSFPEELNKVFSSWVTQCEDQGRPEIGHRLISASLFLRFLCPAILSPSLFGLTQPYPEPLTLRTLTLTAKVMQNLANFTLFGEKEEYMLFMNEFLQQHWEAMRGFLQAVSNPDSDLPMASFDGYVDLPLRLAVLHGLLVDIICKKDQHTIERLHPLPSILNNITESLGADLSKFSPHQSSLQQLPIESKGLRDRDSRPKRSMSERRPVTRTQSAPHRRPGHNRYARKRQTSTEDLQVEDPEQQTVAEHPLDISSPQTAVSIKAAPKPVPWIKHIHSKEMGGMEKRENEQLNKLDMHAEELSELRLGVEQVTERELEMAKRLEDFIAQSQEQNETLQEEMHELRNTVTMREEQLASATFRLGMIEEEREEDGRRLNAAIAAAERINVLEEQLADMLKDLHRLTETNTPSPREPHGNSD